MSDCVARLLAAPEVDAFCAEGCVNFQGVNFRREILTAVVETALLSPLTSVEIADLLALAGELVKRALSEVTVVAYPVICPD